MSLIPSTESDVTRLASTMRVVQRLLVRLDAEHAPVLGNALLNLAVGRMIEADGVARTARVLARLADAIVTSPAPLPERAIDLSSLNA